MVVCNTFRQELLVCTNYNSTYSCYSKWDKIHKKNTKWSFYFFTSCSSWTEKEGLLKCTVCCLCHSGSNVICHLCYRSRSNTLQLAPKISLFLDYTKNLQYFHSFMSFSNKKLCVKKNLLYMDIIFVMFWPSIKK